MLREARSLSRRADKLNGTAAGGGRPRDPAAHRAGLHQHGAAWCTTSCSWNVRHSAASSHQLGPGSTAARSEAFIVGVAQRGW